MNFPSSRLLRSSPLVPSRALFHNFPLPSSSSSSSLPSILLPVPRVPTQTSRSVHNPNPPSFSSSSKEEGSQRSVEPRNHDFFFFLPLFLPPPSFCSSSSSSRIGPTAVLFRLDCPHRALLGSRAPIPPSTRPRRGSRNILLLLLLLASSRRSRAGGDANRFLVAPVAPCRSNANRSTLRFRHAATFPVPQESSFHRLPSFATTL